MVSKIIRWSLNNRLLVIIIGIILFVMGSFSAINTPVDVLPEFAPPQIVVQTQAPGFAAEEVESLVTIPLESALNGLPKIQAVRSNSFEGLSFVTVVFEWGTDVYRARQLVSEKAQQASVFFPKSISAPVLSPITSPIGSVYFFALTSKVTPLIDLRTYADWEIRNKLLSVRGVAKVLVYGGDLKQYQILVNPNKLRQYSIGLNQVIEAAEKANVIVGGGYLVEDDREYLIRGIGKINSIEELSNCVIAQKESVPVYLRDIANVKIGAAFKRSYGSVDGKEAVIVAISRQSGVNTLEVNKGTQEALKTIKKALPEDVKITQTYSQSNFIDTSIKNIISAIFEGSILVIIVLFLFLGNWRTSFISLTAIPLSLIVAILILKTFDQTINSMTLGGLAVAVGEIVDDAIIDVENVYKRLRQNKLSANPKPAFEVIFNASCEVRNSVVYGTYIITVVFLPVLFLTGIAGQIFKPLAWAYIISLFASLGIALILTPAMCFFLLGKGEHLLDHEPKIITVLKEKYSKLLEAALKNAKPIFSATIALSLVAIIIFFTMGRSFLPELGEENLVVMAISPPGTSLKATQKIALRMEKKLHKYPEVITIGNRAGRSESDDEPISANTSHFDITLKKGISQKETERLIEDIREDFERIPGLVTLIRSFITETIEQIITGQRAPIVLKLYGNDLDTLQKYAARIGGILSKIKTLKEVQVEPITNIPQIHIKIRKNIAARYGLRKGDLLEIIQTGFNGITTAQRVIEGQKSFDLLVWFDKPYRKNISIIRSTLIDTPMGVKIPLGQLADVIESTGPNIINREKVSRRIVIQANAKKRDISKSVEKAQKLINEKLKLPEGYTLEFEGDYKQQQEANKKLFLLSILILAAIYLLLSLAFKSFKVATIIMFNLPFALVGGIIATALTNGTLSIASVIGFITLFGISTRNAILLVNRFFDIQKDNPDLSIELVIKQGALDRLTPILMTALTAALAMLPLALFPGAGREIEHPLAIVILGGMFSTTTLTLLVIPVIYKKLHTLS